MITSLEESTSTKGLRRSVSFSKSLVGVGRIEGEERGKDGRERGEREAIKRQLGYAKTFSSVLMRTSERF